MKIRRYIGMAAIAVTVAAGLAGCSQSEVEAPATPRPAGTYYLTLTMSLPTEAAGTRSGTETDGSSEDDTVDATAKENTLSDAVVYFYDPDDYSVLLTLSEIETRAEDVSSSTGEKTYTLTYPIDFDVIREKIAGETVGLAVVGNTTKISYNLETSGQTMLTSTFTLDGVESEPLGLFGKEGAVLPLMNAEEFTVDFTSLDKDGNDSEILAALNALAEGASAIFTHAENVFKFKKAISLERGVARIEYKDRARATTTTPAPDTGNDSGSAVALDLENTAHVFPVDNTPGLYLKLYSMKPFNVNKTSYLFRQAVKGSLTAANTQEHLLLKEENGYTSGSEYYNWIITPDWTGTDSYSKGSDFWSKLSVSDNAYQFGDVAESISANDGTVLISSLFKNVENPSAGYHPWIYVSENTIPSTSLMTGENLLTYATGVAFTFEVLDANGDVLKSTSLTNLPSCITKSEEEGKTDHIIITDENSQWIEVAPDATDNTYRITYVAPLMHNVPNNWNGETLQPMHYGVVRNNTYQMSINSIKGLPLPNEPEDLYLAIDIRVLAWAKREIHVSF